MAQVIHIHISGTCCERKASGGTRQAESNQGTDRPCTNAHLTRSEASCVCLLALTIETELKINTPLRSHQQVRIIQESIRSQCMQMHLGQSTKGAGVSTIQVSVDIQRNISVQEITFLIRKRTATSAFDFVNFRQVRREGGRQTPYKEKRERNVKSHMQSTCTCPFHITPSAYTGNIQNCPSLLPGN
jgi:hypothetical protein